MGIFDTAIFGRGSKPKCGLKPTICVWNIHF
jgi:hypothetical protein